jgi:hypothetical protein
MRWRMADGRDAREVFVLAMERAWMVLNGDLENPVAD